MKTSFLLLILCLISGCATPPGATESLGATESSPPEAKFLNLADRRFTSPGDGTIFQITLGKRLENTGGVTPIPDGIVGERQATASHYSIKNKDGAGYVSAESSISEEFARDLDRIKIQYERESGRILVTEDTSDALPCKRYILFTPTRPGYNIEYLAPKYESHFKEQGFPSPPSQVILMSGDRAWVGGEILPISQIPKSKHPFSLGG